MPRFLFLMADIGPTVFIRILSLGTLVSRGFRGVTAVT